LTRKLERSGPRAAGWARYVCNLRALFLKLTWALFSETNLGPFGQSVKRPEAAAPVRFGPQCTCPSFVYSFMSRICTCADRSFSSVSSVFRTSVSEILWAIGLSRHKEPTSLVPVFSVWFSVRTEQTQNEEERRSTSLCRSHMCHRPWSRSLTVAVEA
jgi:hypothetical protein